MYINLTPILFSPCIFFTILLHRYNVLHHCNIFVTARPSYCMFYLVPNLASARNMDQAARRLPHLAALFLPQLINVQTLHSF